MDEKQQRQAQMIIQTLRQQRDAANDEIVNLSVRLGEVATELAALKAKTAQEPDVDNVVPMAKEA